jgi:hypothetical protein
MSIPEISARIERMMRDARGYKAMRRLEAQLVTKHHRATKHTYKDHIQQTNAVLREYRSEYGRLWDELHSAMEFLYLDAADLARYDPEHYLDLITFTATKSDPSRIVKLWEAGVALGAPEFRAAATKAALDTGVGIDFIRANNPGFASVVATLEQVSQIAPVPPSMYERMSFDGERKLSERLRFDVHFADIPEW